MESLVDLKDHTRVCNRIQIVRWSEKVAVDYFWRKVGLWSITAWITWRLKSRKRRQCLDDTRRLKHPDPKPKLGWPSQTGSAGTCSVPPSSSCVICWSGEQDFSVSTVHKPKFRTGGLISFVFVCILHSCILFYEKFTHHRIITNHNIPCTPKRMDAQFKSIASLRWRTLAYECTLLTFTTYLVIVLVYEI